MNIGFDAKRAFHNGTGLGHYSRTLIRSLSRLYPDHQYYLFNPKPSPIFSLEGPNLHEIRPTSFAARLFHPVWRSSWIKKDLKKSKIDLYHGLSHEIPVGIDQTDIKSVVTIHDLIHERFPQQYNPIDVRIYRRKFHYACIHADRVIAVSEQTKKDVVEFYKINENKTSVCYQSCNPSFGETISAEEKERVRKLYHLPSQFFLYVGSIIERKNLLNICKALFLLRNELMIPLVVIGDGGRYKQQVKDYILQNGVDQRIIFLSENTAAKNSKEFQTAHDFPAIYQSALAMIYPSFFEGFGIPVLEALWSRLPVITSSTSCLPEVGGDAAFYVNPSSAEEIAHGMKRIHDDSAFAKNLTEKGWRQAQNFTPEKCASKVMDVYNGLW